MQLKASARGLSPREVSTLRRFGQNDRLALRVARSIISASENPRD